MLIGLKKIGAIAGQIRALDQQARAAWKDVKPLALGLKVRRYGYEYQITGGYVHRGIVQVSGRRINARTGLVGARDYSLGYLGDCELIDKPLDGPEDVEPAAQ